MPSFDLNPRGNLWLQDCDRFGRKLLSKMGWSEGKGLGKNEDGIKENLKVRMKKGHSGVGWEPKMVGIDTNEYDAVLKSLNEKYQTPIQEEKKSPPKGLEKRSHQFKKRLHYQKFVQGKDICRYSEKDMKSIFFGKKKQDEDAEPIISKSTVTNVDTGTFNSQINMKEYFKSKSKKKAAVSPSKNSLGIGAEEELHNEQTTVSAEEQNGEWTVSAEEQNGKQTVSAEEQNGEWTVSAEVQNGEWTVSAEEQNGERTVSAEEQNGEQTMSAEEQNGEQTMSAEEQNGEQTPKRKRKKDKCKSSKRIKLSADGEMFDSRPSHNVQEDNEESLCNENLVCSTTELEDSNRSNEESKSRKRKKAKNKHFSGDKVQLLSDESSEMILDAENNLDAEFNNYNNQISKSKPGKLRKVKNKHLSLDDDMYLSSDDNSDINSEFSILNSLFSIQASPCDNVEIQASPCDKPTVSNKLKKLKEIKSKMNKVKKLKDKMPLDNDEIGHEVLSEDKQPLVNANLEKNHSESSKLQKLKSCLKNGFWWQQKRKSVSFNDSVSVREIAEGTIKGTDVEEIPVYNDDDESSSDATEDSDDENTDAKEDTVENKMLAAIEKVKGIFSSYMDNENACAGQKHDNCNKKSTVSDKLSTFLTKTQNSNEDPELKLSFPCLDLPAGRRDEWLTSQKLAAKMGNYQKVLVDIRKHPLLGQTNILDVKGYGNWGF